MDDLRIVKRQLKLNKLNAYANFVGKARTAINQIHTLDRAKQGRLLQAVLKKLNIIEVPVGYKKLNASLINETKGLIDGYNDGLTDELTQTQFSAVYATVKTKARDIEDEIKLLEAGIEEFESEADKETTRILKQTNKQAQKLSKAKNKKWMVVRASVIPVPNNACINVQKLQRTFDCDNMNGYACMHRQLCLAVNKKFLQQEGVKNVKQYVNELVEYLSAQKGTELISITTKGMISDITGMSVNWYWLMTKHEAENFRQAFTNLNSSDIHKSMGVKGIAVRDWGFANAS
jgi:hypothetical protein